MRIYTDESVDVAIVEGLKRRDMDAFSATEAGNLGLTDEEQLNYANLRNATIFTHDTDFLQIAAGWMEAGRTHHGIIYCHQASYPIGECIRRLRLLSILFASEDMVDRIEFL